MLWRGQSITLIEQEIEKVHLPMPFRMQTPLKSISMALALSLATATQIQAEGLAGAYLAARQASSFSDFEVSSQYFSRALTLDQNNPVLMENALLAFVGLGKIDRGASIARKMQADGLSSQLANMVVIADLAKKGKFDQIITSLKSGKTIGPLIDRLVLGWAKIGLNNADAAFADFDKVITDQQARDIGRYNTALAMGTLGRFQEAAALFAAKGDDGFQVSVQSALAYGQILSQLDRNQDAIAMIDTIFADVNNPAINKMRADLAAGKKLAFSSANSARKGIAEVFFTIANALDGEAVAVNTLIYARMSQALNPDHMQATLLAAGLLESLKRYDLAIKAYNQVPRDHPFYYLAELGRTKALRRSGKTEAGIEALNQLAKSFPGKPSVHSSLGDALRADGQYALASDAYSKAIDLIAKPDENDWFLFYARAISYERTDKWDQAEADFRYAMTLKPNQPQVLNYFGYSMLEKKINLDEALSLIQRAVEAQPNSGYILDSLGWGYYLLKRYDEAAATMLKAIKLMPVDAIVTDHLGDTLWAVGRHREAYFQWRRALSFDPDEKDAVRIRKKLELGLDAVLIEEGQEPTPVATNGG